MFTFNDDNMMKTKFCGVSTKWSAAGLISNYGV